MPCDVLVLLVKCIPTCIFTATTTDENCSCPHYHGYTTNSVLIPEVLPWIFIPIFVGILPLLSPLLR